MCLKCIFVFKYGCLNQNKILNKFSIMSIEFFKIDMIHKKSDVKQYAIVDKMRNKKSIFISGAHFKLDYYEVTTLIIFSPNFNFEFLLLIR